MLLLLHRLRVVRTYKPGQKGAKRLAQRFGRQLVCVRHRINAGETRRYTTVELVVSSTPITRKRPRQVSLRIPFNDQISRAMLMANGAEWHPGKRTWTLPRTVARKLGLMHHELPTDEQEI